MKKNWNLIKTKSGFADHIPNCIQNLNSPDEKTRYDAYWGIDNFAVVQSDLYEAAYYVIEPIVELLEREYTVDRLYPIRILTEIALGGNGLEIYDFEGRTMTVQQACRDMLMAMASRIKNIEIRSSDEKKEMEDLLDELNSYFE